MPRPKKLIKSKEPVKLRSRLRSNGNRALYLDIYHNGHRKTEYLKLYLIPDNAPGADVQNENTMRAANAIKAKRILQLTNRVAGIADNTQTKITLGAFLKDSEAKKEPTQPRAAASLKWLRLYMEKWNFHNIRLCEIDKAFCTDVIDKFRKTELATNTQQKYLTVFGTALNNAVRLGLIHFNPLNQIDPADKIKKIDTMREFLTIYEVKQLINTPCRNMIIKHAFLFSCFCGLRRSDIGKLTWGDIRNDNGNLTVYVKMQKTKQPLMLPLSADAVKWLLPRYNAPDKAKVFGEFTRMGQIVLKDWAKEAGIKKNVSFHTARHTFATMLITLGADLYTVSKLLGHSNITETQIYAKLVDEKKVKAVELFNGVFDTEK